MSVLGKKLNKGEWAEFYVMLKLLGEGKLYTANNLLQKNHSSYLDILKVIRQEKKSNLLEYVVDKVANTISIRNKATSEELVGSIPCSDFIENARKLFNGIKDLKDNSVPAPDDVCHFAEFIYIQNPKAPSVQALKEQFGGKNDIYIEVRDSQTAIVSVMGFSIKSKFGSNPTLFNAGTSSQFLYKLSGCCDVFMEEFNKIFEIKIIKGVEKTIRDWSKCLQYLSDKNMELEYVGTQYPMFHNNLLLVRESMDKILAWCIKERLIDTYEEACVKEVVEKITKSNPLGVPNPAVYYEKAVKDFLMAGFTGMTASKEWDGKEQVNGGYIVVMEDGDVICYHSNDRESFRDYLYRNTRFEYVSSKKFKWSFIHKSDSEFYLPLNVSVRFNKHTR